ncbi:hypothetical protein MRGA327_15225 [Mycobacterium tuberculosis RGTB327]|nr:hypothetical protein MRGA327_15225 [Mycobacterium tuberculosis RGTB327]
MEIHLFFVGIPLLLVVVLSVLIWSRKGPHPATYKLSGALDTPAHPVGRHRRGRWQRARRTRA